jgi:hypothetical protein
MPRIVVPFVAFGSPPGAIVMQMLLHVMALMMTTVATTTTTAAMSWEDSAALTLVAPCECHTR